MPVLTHIYNQTNILYLHALEYTYLKAGSIYKHSTLKYTYTYTDKAFKYN